MAETLGSLIDKLTIKQLREYHIKEMKLKRNKKFTTKELEDKLKILARQKKEMYNEIDDFIKDAVKKNKVVKDEKLKIYNKREHMGRVGKITSLAKAIEMLGKKNTELWHLEDEARREDKPLSYIGKIKRKIDVTNQSRNDYIDLVDDLFAKMIAVEKKKKK